MSSPPAQPKGSESIPSIFTGNQQSTPRPSQIGRQDTSADISRHAQQSPQRTASTSEQPTETRPRSPDANDRVFPIRSVVSVDPTPYSYQTRTSTGDSYFGAVTSPINENGLGSFARIRQLGGRDDEPSEARDSDPSETSTTSRKTSYSQRGNELFQVGKQFRGHSLLSDRESDRSDDVSNATNKHVLLDNEKGTASVGGRSSFDEAPLVTARFKHVVTDGGHAVITGRDGETLQRCEDEPIHIPGAVQSFGALMALQEEAEGKLVPRIVSENAKRILGYTPRQLFALDSFTDILSDEQTDNLLDHIDFVREDGTDVEANGPEVFTMSIRDPLRKLHKLWCAIHTRPQHADLIICEFELEDDQDYPLIPKETDKTPEVPEDTLGSEPTEEELRDSTAAHSRPLRVLRSARKRKGEAAAMEVFNIMSQVQEQLGQAASLDQFLKVLVGVVKELTGFHRVMVYQFDSNFNGKVVTELVDPRATKDLYKGLHFPASDIPKQAREMYKLNKVRLLYDRDHETARLVCRTTEDLETPLDMTHSYLRAMSPIHVKYLANMAVRSSMSISINAFNELWGLISCHAYGRDGTRVSFPIRKMCRLVGDTASRNIERLSYASRLQARKLINTSPTSKNPSGYIIASSDDLLSLFDSDYGLLSIHDETKILGKLEATQEALALLEYLRMRRFTSVVMSQDIRFDFQDLRYPPGFKSIAGVLFVPLSVGGHDFIVFFRKGQLKEVKWAGNPYEKFAKQGTEGYLEPRKSFKTWSETVVGKCKEWSEEEIETAGVLCLVYGKFIEVWREKEAAMQNTQLTRLLLQNSAHEVRTPLNAIINYLEIAMEGSLDTETRDNLSKSHSASKSLIYVINDLLDLTKTESSSQLTHEEVCDLSQVFHEAVDAFAGDARRKQLSFEVSEDPGLPAQVLGDPRRIRQAISNIIANAIEATSQGGITIQMAVAIRYEASIDVEVVIEDTGKGMSSQELDELFMQLEQAQSEQLSTPFPDEAVEPESLLLDVKSNKRVLGLGLAVVARIVRNMGGQLRLKSEEGKGTRFVIVFPFTLPPSALEAQIADGSSSMAGLNLSSDGTSSNLTEKVPQRDAVDTGEVTLVAKATQSMRDKDASSAQYLRSPSLTRQNSGGSFGSLNSFKSNKSNRSWNSAHSGKSDVDRLISAIQEPSTVRRTFSSDGSQTQNRSQMSLQTHHRPQSADFSGNVPPHLRENIVTEDGRVEVAYSKTPIRAIRVPDEGVFHGFREPAALSPQQPVTEEQRPAASSNPLSAEKLNVLIAEDDPINSKILQKRLQKGGHETFLTVNGEECSSQYGERSGFYDIVLMDMQMPIVDGMTSAKMIRSYEKTNPTHCLSPRASLNGRVPIFAVSASLVEKNRQTYIDAGFDGWILKPVSFKRVNELLKGIVDKEVRGKNAYQPGHWEQGGWFEAARRDVFDVNTIPDEGHVPSSGPSEESRQGAESGPERSEQMQQQVEMGMEAKEDVGR